MSQSNLCKSLLRPGKYESNLEYFNRDVGKLRILSGLDRRKSISLSVLPNQNINFLCVPSEPSPRALRRSSSDRWADKRTKSFESLRRIATETSLEIPEDFSFTSVKIETYKIRWALLGLCGLYTGISYMQWIQYSIIANIVMEYYNVEYSSVDSLSLIFMVTYVVFCFPVSYYMDVRGLRKSALIGAIGTSVGAWIKVFSLNEDQFGVAFVGQFVVALAQVFILLVPGRLASEWFSEARQSRVSAIFIFSCNLGVALGFFITPIIVRNNRNKRQIRDDLYTLTLGTAVVSTIIAALVIVLFKSSPKNPPTYVQAIQKTVGSSNKDFWPIVLKLVQNKEYMKLVLASGINVGTFSAFNTHLNQIVLGYFPNAEQDAGKVGLCLIVFGAIGSVVFGYILDITHKYKETAVLVCKLGSIAMAIFCMMLESHSKKMLFTTSFILGFFMLGFQPIAYEYAAEITFPEPDNIVGSIMTVSTHLFGFLITLFVAKINSYLGDLTGNLSFAILLFASTTVVSSIKSECKRCYAHAEIAEVAKELQEIGSHDATADQEEFSELGIVMKIDVVE